MCISPPKYPPLPSLEAPRLWAGAVRAPPPRTGPMEGGLGPHGGGGGGGLVRRRVRNRPPRASYLSYIYVQNIYIERERERERERENDSFVASTAWCCPLSVAKLHVWEFAMHTVAEICIHRHLSCISHASVYHPHAFRYPLRIHTLCLTHVV